MTLKHPLAIPDDPRLDVEPSTSFEIIHDTDRIVVCSGEVEKGLFGLKIGYVCQGCALDNIVSRWWFYHLTDSPSFEFSIKKFHDFMNDDHVDFWWFTSEGMHFCPKCYYALREEERHDSAV